MAGCAVGVLLTGLSRISPKIQGKKQGKIARVQGPVCGSVQARNFLPDSCSCVECSCVEPACGLPDRKRRARGTGQDGGQGRAVHGVVPGLACGGVTGRTGPAHVNPVISHRHPDICPDMSSSEPGSRDSPGPGHRTRSCPGNNGVAPGEQDGTGKTGHPDRRRDLSDLMRRTGAGIPRAGPERATSREGFFAAGHAGIPDFFFTAGIAQIPAQPLRRFPRAFQGGISFRAQGPFRFR